MRVAPCASRVASARVTCCKVGPRIDGGTACADCVVRVAPTLSCIAHACTHATAQHEASRWAQLRACGSLTSTPEYSSVGLGVPRVTAAAAGTTTSTSARRPLHAASIRAGGEPVVALSRESPWPRPAQPRNMPRLLGRAGGRANTTRSLKMRRRTSCGCWWPGPCHSLHPAAAPVPSIAALHDLAVALLPFPVRLGWHGAHLSVANRREPSVSSVPSADVCRQRQRAAGDAGGAEHRRTWPQRRCCVHSSQVRHAPRRGIRFAPLAPHRVPFMVRRDVRVLQCCW